MRRTLFSSTKNLIIYFIIICFHFSCTKENIQTNEEPLQNQIDVEWRQEMPLPEHFRLDAKIYESENKIFLLPGKGNYNFSVVPEILSFDGNGWVNEFDYTGFALAGNSGYWQQDNFGYILGGVNGSSAPTNEIQKIDFTTQTTTTQTNFPFGTLRKPGSCNTSSKGYLSVNFNTSNEVRPIYSYDFNLNIWDSIPSPTSLIYKRSYMASKLDSIYLILPTESDNNFFVIKEGATQWTTLPKFPGATRSNAIFHQYNDYLVYGAGLNNDNLETIYNDVWLFDLSTQEWQEVEPYQGTSFHSGFSFVLNGRLYFGGGATQPIISSGAMNKEVWSLSLKD